tara:strand:+ start:5591 stop:5881 length:291 start_codon:yes stop_codon:yes gene_type:complete
MTMATDAKSFPNISADTGAFTLQGGTYAIVGSASWGGGTVKLQALSLDGATWIDIPNASLTANGFLSPLYLPAGQYQFDVATATAVYISVVNVPQE